MPKVKLCFVWEEKGNGAVTTDKIKHTTVALRLQIIFFSKISLLKAFLDSWWPKTLRTTPVYLRLNESEAVPSPSSVAAPQGCAAQGMSVESSLPSQLNWRR